VRKNQSKDNPKAYCATIKGKVEKETIRYLAPITLTEAVENEAKIGGVAISATTSRNKNKYTVKSLENNDTLKGMNIGVGHSNNPADNIGLIENTKFDGKNLNYGGKVFNTARYPDAIDMIKNKLWQFVSIEAIPKNVKKNKEGLTVHDLEFIGLDFVKSPGVREASAAIAGESFGIAIEEAYNINKEEKYMEEKSQPEEEEKVEAKVIEKVVTDPKVLKLLEKFDKKFNELDKKIEKLKEEAEEEKTEEPEAEEKEAEEEQPEKEEEKVKSKAVVQEEVPEKGESNIIWEGSRTSASFWVHPGPHGEFVEAV